MVAAAAFTYKTKHDAESRFAEVRRLQEQIRLEENAIDVLRADWSLLTQPARLQQLAERFQDELELESAAPHQIADISDIPLRPLTIDDLAAQADELASGASVLGRSVQ